MRPTIVMTLALLATSCSFIAATKAPGHSERCIRSKVFPIVDTIVVGSAAFADIGAATCKETQHSDGGFGQCFGAKFAAGLMSIVALPYIISAIDGYALDRCPSEAEIAAVEEHARAQLAMQRELREQQERADRASQTQAEARARAGALTKNAASAARTGDCTTAQALEPQVHDIDPDFHDTVFIRDAAIARCLRP